MNRAAVFIGVDRCRGLPPLRGAARGAREMANWARGQGVRPVKVFTDEAGKGVAVGKIKETIEQIISRDPSLEQLIVYFAGHGVTIGYGDQWLLSAAPEDPDASINVLGSVVRAQYGVVPHVVLISDACRTAPEEVQAQGITGSTLFPSPSRSGRHKDVDRFYACLLGRTAVEVADGQTTADEYRAIYTAALLAGLSEGGPADAEGYVRLRPLDTFLSEEVARRIRAITPELKTALVQEPDAIITSDERSWISRMPPDTGHADAARPRRGGGAARGGRRRPGPGSGRRKLPGSPGRELTFRDREPRLGGRAKSVVLDALLRYALTNDVGGFADTLFLARETGVGPLTGIADAVDLAKIPLGRTLHGMRCGFIVSGARFADAFAANLDTEVMRGGEAVCVAAPRRPGDSVLLIFEDGSGVPLPALPEFVASLTLKDGELVDVAYEPGAGSDRWPGYTRKAREIRTLRAVAASSTQNGIFKLEGDDADTLARRMQQAKFVDPALAIYAAYSYQSFGRPELIAEMGQYMTNDLGGRLFDLELLSGGLDDRPFRRLPPQVLGFAPLLAQGWALLPALQVRLAPSLEDVERSLLPSAWTLFGAPGVERVTKAMANGEVS